MNTIIELHDSKVAQITKRDGTVIVHFLSVYLHKSGEFRQCRASWAKRRFHAAITIPVFAEYDEVARRVTVPECRT